MRIILAGIGLVFIPVSVSAQSGMSRTEAAQLYSVAGFSILDGQPVNRCGKPAKPRVTLVDINGDKRPDTGRGYWLVSKLANGGWRLMTNGTGIPEFLKTRGTDGWPDVSIGGRGFCFPVERWNGREYKVHRWEYEGKACKPPR